jgi:rare lipoprotein A
MPTTRDTARDRRTPRSRRAAGLLAALALAFGHFGWAKADSLGSSSGAGSSLGRQLAALVQEGVVSWYGAAFHDRPTASGERFDSGALTMAHPSLPFGTRVKVTNLRNGRAVVVRVNDRGPFVGKRIADLSQAAASEIGMMRRGVARVRLEVLQDFAVPETD